MEHAEANGKTVDVALKAALAKLNANADEVEITVLDEGQRGGRLFGRGSRDAVVRVERRSDGRRERTPEPPDTTIPRGRGTRGGSGRGGGGSGGAGGGGNRDRGRRGGGGGRGGERGGSGGQRGPRVERAPELTEQDFFGDGAAPPAPAPRPAAPSRGSGGSPRGGSGGSPRGGSGGSPRGGSGGSPRGGSGGPPRRDRPRRRREEEHIEPDINAEEVDLAAEVVDSILQILDIDADINIREPVTPGDGLGSARAVIDISGEDLGMLIGRRGESLLAFQYVVNLVITRRFPGRGSVTVDVEEYRRRREEQLMSLAGRMAEVVRESGEPITLEPMSAAERRLVHLSLADDPEVETNSTGEGDSRKVVISLLED